jgi:CheY-specific phosphatase CheX
MKSIKNNIIIFPYLDSYTAKTNALLFQEILDQKSILQEREIIGIFIKMKNITIPLSEAKIFIQKLTEISLKLGIPCALGEYRSNMFPTWQKATRESSIKLFKTEQIAQLFFHPKSLKKKFKVLLFDDGDEEEVEKQASLLTRFEHNIVYTHDKQDFQKKLENNMVDFAIDQTKLNQDFNNVAKEKSSHSLNLSKNLIANLPLFIDTAVDTLMTITGLDAQKNTHSITTFKSSLSGSFICSLMKFSGDVKGNFVLIFPKDLAKNAIEAMIGESVEADEDTLKDGIGEFSNIITGSSKTKLQAKKINILFELPQTFTTLIQAQKKISDANGIWIEMQLEKRIFYMFINS